MLPYQDVGLAASLEEQRAARTLLGMWSHASEQERRSSEAALVGFLERFPLAPSSTRMRLFLGWIRLGQGRLDEAERLAEQAAEGNSVVTRDGVEILRAALLTRRKGAAEAFERLMTLRGLVVEADDRDDWGRECTRAALSLERQDDALDCLYQWRIEATVEQLPRLDDEIERYVAGLGRLPLERGLARFTALAALPSTQPERQRGKQAMIELVRQKLVTHALADVDSELALRLLGVSDGSLRRGPTGEKLVALAAKGEKSAPSAGPVIGVLMDLNDQVIRRQSTELVAGMVRTLFDTERRAVHLVSREGLSGDDAELSAALRLLLVDGASVIVAVTGHRDLQPFERFAEEQGLPVVAVRSPGRERSHLFGVLDWEPMTEALVRSQLPASERLDAVRAEDPACGDLREPGAEQRIVRAPGQVLFLTDADCARRMLAVDRLRNPRAHLWLGPEALSADRDLGAALAGMISSPALLDVSGEPELSELERRLRRRVTWLEALGRDLATLAAGALTRVGTTTVEGDEASSAYRRGVSRELEHIETRLWTSKKRGFGAERLLVPDLVLESVALGQPTDKGK